jgi:hypothetical protein
MHRTKAPDSCFTSECGTLNCQLNNDGQCHVLQFLNDAGVYVNQQVSDNSPCSNSTKVCKGMLYSLNSLVFDCYSFIFMFVCYVSHVWLVLLLVAGVCVVPPQFNCSLPCIHGACTGRQVCSCEPGKRLIPPSSLLVTRGQRGLYYCQQ